MTSPQTTPVADLHTDLLAYLGGGDGTRSINDDVSRCSLSQLRAGGVSTQILPIYVPGGHGAFEWAMAQQEAFGRLLGEYGEHFVHRFGSGDADDARIRVALAVENASGLGTASEPVSKHIERLEDMVRQWGPVVYLSLTWAVENRFGGGNGKQDVGLKDDGRRLLEAMARLQIPLDLSHASAPLIEQSLDFIDRHFPDMVVMASHCNVRALREHSRNLTDRVMLEVKKRGGVLGLTYIRAFLGEGIERLVEHVEHVLGLGLGEQLCLGADFFCELDLPNPSSRQHRFFFEDFDTAACHQRVLEMLRPGIEPQTLQALAHGNLERWLDDRAAVLASP